MKESDMIIREFMSLYLLRCYRKCKISGEIIALP